MNKLVRTIWINLGIYLGSVLWTAFGILISPLAYLWLKATKEYSKVETFRRLIWTYGRVWISIVSLFVPVERAKGTPPSPCILVINHASFFDTYLVGAQPNRNICLTIRDWPYKIPFYRQFMEAAEYVNTESTDMDEAIEQSVQALETGSTLVFFPEGTRSATGKLGRFRSGAFYTSLKADIPVVPMCISGNHKLLAKGSKVIQYSPIKVSLLPPVYPDKYLKSANGHIQMRKDVKALMASALDDMAKESESI